MTIDFGRTTGPLRSVTDGRTLQPLSKSKNGNVGTVFVRRAYVRASNEDNSNDQRHR